MSLARPTGTASLTERLGADADAMRSKTPMRILKWVRTNDTVQFEDTSTVPPAEADSSMADTESENLAQSAQLSGSLADNKPELVKEDMDIVKDSVYESQETNKVNVAEDPSTFHATEQGSTHSGNDVTQTDAEAEHS